MAKPENHLVRLHAALLYAGHGWRVLPLHWVTSEGGCSCGHETCSSIGKHPLTPTGVKAATCERGQITRWWQHWPRANVGIATGNGLYVIDIDTAKGASWAPLNEFNLPDLYSSLIARTGSGGYHIYLSHDRALSIANTCNRLGAFIDTRGEGGYVVAPPSHNKDGAYTWAEKNPVLPLTPELLAKLTALGCVKPSAAPQGKDHSYEPMHTQNTHLSLPADQPRSHATGAAPAEQARLSAARPAGALTGNGADKEQRGQLVEARNMYLISLAGTLRGRGLDQETIMALLLTANEQRYGQGKHADGPLSLDELQRTVFKSVAAWEQAGGIVVPKLPQVDSLRSLMGRIIPEPTWLVPGLLSEGLILLAGKPKLGKSWLTLHLALVCAQGTIEGDGLVLGRYPVEPLPVLYLGLEDKESNFQARVRLLWGAREVPANFNYAFRWQPLLAGGLHDLEAYLASAPETRLVVIDTLAKVRTPSSSSGSVYQEDYALMGELYQLVVRHHTTILLVHHTRKMASADAFDEISGSTGLTGAVDSSLVLKRERGHQEAVLHLTGRDVQEQELALVFQDGCIWSCTGNVAERQQSSARQAILDLLRDHDSLTPAEIAKELAKPSGTIRTMLLRMGQDQEVVKQGDGKYVRKESAKERDQADVGLLEASWKDHDADEEEAAVSEWEDRGGEE